MTDEEIKNKWVEDPNGISENHWIDLIYKQEEEDELSHWAHACVKWDGCIHFDKASNVPFSKEYGFHNGNRNKEACDDYIHICDIDDFIKMLEALKQKAIEHFKDQEYWEELKEIKP